MKFILSIGGAEWLCESAMAAAKIADQLGNCAAVQEVYQAGSDPAVYLEKADFRHDLRIKPVTEKMLITKSQAKVSELIKANLPDQATP